MANDRMTTAPLPRSTALTGILFAIGGSAGLSVNDMAVKFLSSDYALHQVILTRSLIAALVLIVVIIVGGTGFAQLKTRRWGAHLVRVGLILISNVTFFLGLAALPLADGVAIGFVAPLLIVAMSVLFLGETVGPRRWMAVAVGLLGVVVMLRPGAGVIDPAAILVLIAAACYGSGHLMTRRMRDTESAMTLTFYVVLGFLIISLIMGVITGHGRWADQGDPSLAFLLRGWHWPAAADWPAFIAVGIGIAVGGLMISQAYRLGEAGLIAPFEYIAMPLAIFWGVLIFGQWPDLTAWIGIALIIGAGLYALWRETRVGRG